MFTDSTPGQSSPEPSLDCYDGLQIPLEYILKDYSGEGYHVVVVEIDFAILRELLNKGYFIIYSEEFRGLVAIFVTVAAGAGATHIDIISINYYMQI